MAELGDGQACLAGLPGLQTCGIDPSALRRGVDVDSTGVARPDQEVGLDEGFGGSGHALPSRRA